MTINNIPAISYHISQEVKRGWRLVFAAVILTRFAGHTRTFRHPSLSWTRSQRAVDRGPLFSPSPSAASSAASGSPLSCDVPPPNTAPFSRNLKSQSSRLNQGPCSHSSLLKRQGWSSLCATDQEQDSRSQSPHTDTWISSLSQVPRLTNDLHFGKKNVKSSAKGLGSINPTSLPSKVLCVEKDMLELCLAWVVTGALTTWLEWRGEGV